MFTDLSYLKRKSCDMRREKVDMWLNVLPCVGLLPLDEILVETMQKMKTNPLLHSAAVYKNVQAPPLRRLHLTLQFPISCIPAPPISYNGLPAADHPMVTTP